MINDRGRYKYKGITMINPFFQLIITLLSLYGWVVLIRIVLHWLIHFDIINRHQPFVNRVNYVLFKMTEPVLMAIRRVLPDFGGIDLSPIVLFLILKFLTSSIQYYAYM
jgi:YggT family protein